MEVLNEPPDSWRQVYIKYIKLDALCFGVFLFQILEELLVLSTLIKPLFNPYIDQNNSGKWLDLDLQMCLRQQQ